MGRVVVVGVPALILTGQATVPGVAHPPARRTCFQRPAAVAGHPADQDSSGAEPVAMGAPPRPG
jgi:hypothetical protein